MANGTSATEEAPEMIGARFPPHIIDRIDAKVADMNAGRGSGERPATRSDALRALILVGLSAEDQ